MVLRHGYITLATKLQEASMMQGDVRTRLSDAIQDAHRGTGSYGYYIDHNGDGTSGDVVYSCNGDTRMCGYEISEANGKAVTHLDMENSRNVVPTVTYQEEADEEDHYAAMEESLKAEGIYTDLPLYERFISKGEREKMSSEDFAGKGKSFPIQKPGDIMAAVRSIGRAGPSNLGPSGIKARIIAIAKRKGWESYLPKAWRAEKTEESANVSRRTMETLALTESAVNLEPIVLKEARADYEIKLIAPGPGSSAFYPAEVLKRDGPKVFKAGTHVYLNHPTAAEEAARPEGDVKNLAGVLSAGAVYHESHPKGEGLYGRMKVFADHAQIVEEKAPHVGMSIRASGVAESGKSKDGLPVLKELTSAESVDVVTKPGAGGMILTESARGAGNEGDTMDEAQVQRLIEAAINPYRERALRGDATVEATRILSPFALSEISKQRVIDSILRSTIPVKEGALDGDALKTLVMAEATREAQYVAQLTGAGRVNGMGASLPLNTAEADPEKAAKQERKRLKEARRQNKELVESQRGAFEVLMGHPEAAKMAASRFKGAA